MEQERRAESGAGAVVRAWAEAESRADVMGMLRAIETMSNADKLRVILFIGVGSLRQFGFGAEVGRG